MIIKESMRTDVDYVAENIREADRREILANSGRTPHISLLDGFNHSKPCAYSHVINSETFPATATTSDIKYVADNMRQPDLDEIQALGKPDPHKALEECYRDSKPECYSGVHKNIPVSMFGVVPHPDNPKQGSIWLLGTDQITNDVPISFLRWSRVFLPTLLKDYELVSNIVDKRNTMHIKWIKWLGFSFLREVIYGPENRPFYEFARLN